jgi:membrane protein
MPSVGGSAREAVHTVQKAQGSLPGRAWNRYNSARGGVLAGGMAYVAFFSLFPALAVGFTVFGLVVGHDAQLQARVIKAVNDGVGTTVINTPGQSDGIVDISKLTGSTSLTIAGIVGLVGFLFTGLGWLDAMRESVRAMFGQPTYEGNFIKTKLRDLAMLVSLGLVLLLSAAGGLITSGATGALLKLVGVGEGSVPGRILLGAVSTLVILAVDVVVFVLIFRLLSGVDVPRHDYWDAALFGGVGLGLLKLFGGLLLNSAGHNKFLATAGVLLGLLIWLNLVSRLTLLAAAWGATVAIDRGHLVEGGAPGASAPTSTPMEDDESPARAAREPSRPPRPGTPAERPAERPAGARPVPAAEFEPVVSARQADRVSVAAGAVLGAAGAVAARTAAGAVRSVAAAARRRSDD